MVRLRLDNSPAYVGAPSFVVVRECDGYVCIPCFAHSSLSLNTRRTSVNTTQLALALPLLLALALDHTLSLARAARTLEPYGGHDLDPGGYPDQRILTASEERKKCYVYFLLFVKPKATVVVVSCCVAFAP